MSSEEDGVAAAARETAAATGTLVANSPRNARREVLVGEFAELVLRGMEAPNSVPGARKGLTRWGRSPCSHALMQS